MTKRIHLPTRMCVSCRVKDAQKNLLRLQCKEQNLEVFNGKGRSFYLCNDCIYEQKRVIKSLMRQCRGGDKDKFMNQLKEIIADGRKS